MSKFKEGMKVKVKNITGNILNSKLGALEKGNPIGTIKKIFKYTNSDYKYKVRIAPNCCVYCTDKEIKKYIED